MRSLLIFIIGLILFYTKVYSGEGMWLPVSIDSLNYEEMKEKGLRLSFEDIYSVDNPSLKDAVVIFDNGCTGEVISQEGLLITNHHCGYGMIQSHSSVENDYLKNGFWAASPAEELPNPGLSVKFILKMENVSDKVLTGISDTMPESDRMHRIAVNINEIRNQAILNTHYEAEVKPFYFGKEYYLFVYEIFNDVRLVGAPPESIGRFGGDTDNWIWPRHTGDFSLFRIYAGKDNKPANYSPENIPYKPKKYLNISLNGVKEGDFTMILGYPGKTEQYLTSDGLKMIASKSLPAKIDMRTIRLNAIKRIMSENNENRLRYSSRYVSISNSWKKWIGVTEGITRVNAINSKMLNEETFNSWAFKHSTNTEYANLMKNFSDLYDKYEPVFLANDLGGEFLNSLEISNLVNKSQIEFFSGYDSSVNYDKIRQMGSVFFKTAGSEIDRQVLPELLRVYAKYADKSILPDFYDKIQSEFGGDYKSFVSFIYNKSIYTDSIRYLKLFSQRKQKIRDKIMNDPLFEIYKDFSMMVHRNRYDALDSLNRELNKLYRIYVSGLKEMNPDKSFYPDANFSMRLTYGKVEGYKPKDAITHIYSTSLKGIMEKENPEIEDYHVPAALKEAYRQNDFGIYAENGKLPVCFIASNHTSGGNSGSPVLNSNGELIGINFDRNWEGTVSDYAYDPNMCRNISLDIRYVLFIIDNLANADWILNELTLKK